MEAIRLAGDILSTNRFSELQTFGSFAENASLGPIPESSPPLGLFLISLARLFWFPSLPSPLPQTMPLYDVMCLAAEATSVLKRLSTIRSFSQTYQMILSQGLNQKEWSLTCLSLAGSGVLAFLRPGVRIYSDPTMEEKYIVDYSPQHVGVPVKEVMSKNEIAFSARTLWSHVPTPLYPLNDDWTISFEKDKQTKQAKRLQRRATSYSPYRNSLLRKDNLGVDLDLSEVVKYLESSFSADPTDEGSSQHTHSLYRHIYLYSLFFFANVLSILIFEFSPFITSHTHFQ